MYDQATVLIDKIATYIQEEYAKHKYSDTIIRYDLKSIINPVVENLIEEVKEDTAREVRDYYDD